MMATRPKRPFSRSVQSLVVRSGPTRLNFATSPSKVPCPSRTTSTKSSLVVPLRISANSLRTFSAFAGSPVFTVSSTSIRTCAVSNPYRSISADWMPARQSRICSAYFGPPDAPEMTTAHRVSANATEESRQMAEGTTRATTRFLSFCICFRRLPLASCPWLRQPDPAAHQPLGRKQADDQQQAPSIVPEVLYLGRAHLGRPLPDESIERVSLRDVQILAAGFARQTPQQRVVQARLTHLQIVAADENRAVRRSQPCVAARGRRLDAVDAWLIEANRHRIAAVLRAGQRGRQLPRLPIGSRHAHDDIGIGHRLELAVLHRYDNAIGAAGNRGRQRRDAHWYYRAGGEPSRHLPPDGFVRGVARRLAHAPAPRRFAGKHHRAALAVALNREQRPHVADGARTHGEDS